MRIIHKHQVSLGIAFQLDTTEDAEVVHFGEQNGNLYLWIEFDPSAPVVSYGFRIFGTGEPITPPVDLRVEHLQTCFAQGGAFVWHLYSVFPNGG